MWTSGGFSTICWDCPCSTVSGLLAMFVCVCFWALCFGPLISLSVPLPGPHCLDHCCFIAGQLMSVLQHCSSPSIVCWLFWVHHLSIQTLELVCHYLLNNFLGFWLGHIKPIDQDGNSKRRQVSDREKIFAKDTSDQGLLSKINQNLFNIQQ